MQDAPTRVTLPDNMETLLLQARGLIDAVQILKFEVRPEQASAPAHDALCAVATALFDKLAEISNACGVSR